MLFSIFRLFLAYSAPRFQKNRVPVSVLNVKAGINELTQHRPALDDLNKAQLGRLLEHCKLADVKPYVDHFNLTGKYNIYFNISGSSNYLFTYFNNQECTWLGASLMKDLSLI